MPSLDRFSVTVEITDNHDPWLSGLPIGTRLYIHSLNRGRMELPEEKRVIAAGHDEFWLHTHFHPDGRDGEEIHVVVTASAETGSMACEPVMSLLRCCPVLGCELPLRFAPCTSRAFLEAGGGELVHPRPGSIGSWVQHGLPEGTRTRLRAALLKRVADRAELIRAVWAGEVHLPDDCCTVEGFFICDETCAHWHHRMEFWIA